MAGVAEPGGAHRRPDSQELGRTIHRIGWIVPIVIWYFPLAFLATGVYISAPLPASAQEICKVISAAREGKNIDLSKILKELARVDENDTAALRTALLDPDPSVRKTAAAILGHLRDPAPMMMSRLLDDSSVEVREAAEQALISMGAMALGDLGRVLARGRGDLDTYRRSVPAIGAIGDPEGVSLLCEALNKDPTCLFRHDEEFQALVKIGAMALKCSFPPCLHSDYAFAFALLDPQASIEVCRGIAAQPSAPGDAAQIAASRLKTLQAKQGTSEVLILSRSASGLRWGLNTRDAENLARLLLDGSNNIWKKAIISFFDGVTIVDGVVPACDDFVALSEDMDPVVSAIAAEFFGHCSSPSLPKAEKQQVSPAGKCRKKPEFYGKYSDEYTAFCRGKSGALLFDIATETFYQEAKERAQQDYERKLKMDKNLSNYIAPDPDDQVIYDPGLDFSQRYKAVVCLSERQEEQGRLWEIYDSRPGLRVTTAQLLVKIFPSEAREFLLIEMGRKQLTRRLAAIGALAQIPGPEVSAAIVELVSDSDEKVRQAVTRALGYRPYTEIRTTVTDFLTASDCDNIRRGFWVLDSLKKNGCLDGTAIDASVMTALSNLREDRHCGLQQELEEFAWSFLKDLRYEDHSTSIVNSQGVLVGGFILRDMLVDNLSAKDCNRNRDALEKLQVILNTGETNGIDVKKLVHENNDEILNLVGTIMDNQQCRDIYFQKVWNEVLAKCKTL